ncbi:MAG: hypothetical protein E6920_20270 [Clostridium sp.]|uniref:hypothetical protein n=1 Tax=Paraclostridium sordellii TaxID=1505 RepID=UPI0005DEAD96|nr:hypothetical protein [Paeniclostridium sordellii]MDU1404234.1 hypothetical protein [Clostridium sp.]CEP42418.1 Bacteriocin class II with double-glycine leader peptide [[Clostridium] sordellii] [Paeniclostridium sordellii]
MNELKLDELQDINGGDAYDCFSGTLATGLWLPATGAGAVFGGPWGAIAAGGSTGAIAYDRMKKCIGGIK